MVQNVWFFKKGWGEKIKHALFPMLLQEHLDASKIEMKANVYFIYFHPIGHEDLH